MAQETAPSGERFGYVVADKDLQDLRHPREITYRIGKHIEFRGGQIAVARDIQDAGFNYQLVMAAWPVRVLRVQYESDEPTTNPVQLTKSITVLGEVGMPYEILGPAGPAVAAVLYALDCAETDGEMVHTMAAEAKGFNELAQIAHASGRLVAFVLAVNIANHQARILRKPWLSSAAGHAAGASVLADIASQDLRNTVSAPFWGAVRLARAA